MTARLQRAVIVLVLATCALTSCHRAEQQAQQKAAQAAANEDAATQAARDFDQAVAAQNWAVAKAQGDVLLMNFPGTSAAQRVGAQMDAIRAKVAAARETARVAGLWSYNRVAVK
ncbi:MAG: hypothetical protein JWL98_150, partial [Xanthomonadaceae bacterium]|nr:hypothetical protein [Xanthomonadaceae bacterium]